MLKNFSVDCEEREREREGEIGRERKRSCMSTYK
jgi:hypothetical protein